MPELQSTKPTVKVTVVTDEKKKACDTQDLSRKSLTHKSIGKSPAVSKSIIIYYICRCLYVYDIEVGNGQTKC